jgi:hypothetical protein
MYLQVKIILKSHEVKHALNHASRNGTLINPQGWKCSLPFQQLEIIAGCAGILYSFLCAVGVSVTLQQSAKKEEKDDEKETVGWCCVGHT